MAHLHALDVNDEDRFTWTTLWINLQVRQASPRGSLSTHATLFNCGRGQHTHH